MVKDKPHCQNCCNEKDSAFSMYISNKININNHINNTDVHVTKSDKDKWNNSVSKDNFDQQNKDTLKYIDNVKSSIQSDANDIYQKKSDMGSYADKEYVNFADNEIKNSVDSKVSKQDFDDTKEELSSNIKSVSDNLAQNYYTKSDLDGSFGENYKIKQFSFSGNILTLKQGDQEPMQVDLSAFDGGGSSIDDRAVSIKYLNEQLALYTLKKDIQPLHLTYANTSFVYNPLSKDSQKIVLDQPDIYKPGKYAIYYQNKESNTIAPKVPATGKLPNEYASNTEEGKWDTKYQSRQKGYFTWMAQVLIDGTGAVTTWMSPVCITGSDGEDGVDTTAREYIYHLATSSTYNDISLPSTNQSYDGYVPSDEGWTDKPSGVSQEYAYEMFCWRDKENNKWSDWKPVNGKPLIWSHYGENGRDGDGVEYIYCVSEVTPTGDNDPSNWYTDQQSLNGLGETDSAGQIIKQYNSNQYIKTGSIWQQDAIDLKSQGIPQGKYQYVSIRKKTYDDNASYYWHQYSKPTIWSYVPKDGSNGIKGSVLRSQGEWKAGIEYKDGKTSEDGICYQDYVYVTETEGNKVYYLLVDADAAQKDNWTKTPSETSYWNQMSMTGSQVMDVVIANQADIQRVSSQEVVIKDDDQNIVAGMTSSENYEGSDLSNYVTDKGAVRIWAGKINGGDLSTAPFNVTKDGVVTSGTKNKVVISDGVIWFYVQQSDGTYKKWHLGIGADGKPDWESNEHPVSSIIFYKVTSNGISYGVNRSREIIYRDTVDDIYYSNWISKIKASGDYLMPDSILGNFILGGTNPLDDKNIIAYVDSYRKVSFSNGVLTKSKDIVLLGYNWADSKADGHIQWYTNNYVYYKINSTDRYTKASNIVNNEYEEAFPGASISGSIQISSVVKYGSTETIYNSDDSKIYYYAKQEGNNLLSIEFPQSLDSTQSDAKQNVIFSEEDV